MNLSNGNEVALATLGKVLAHSGRIAAARKLLQEMQLSSVHRYVSPYLIADVQNAVGEDEKAIESLAGGYDQRDMWMIYLEVDPDMDSLRGDSRFKALSQKIGLSHWFAFGGTLPHARPSPARFSCTTEAKMGLFIGSQQIVANSD